MRKKPDLTRKLQKRLPKKKLYIFSEGANSEPIYFKAYARFSASNLIEVICEKGQGVPRTLLERAKAKRSTIKSKRYIQENGDDDQVWIVFDRDEHPGVREVLSESNEAGINVAYSNPCFEVWLILHVADYDRDEHRHLTQRFCESVCAGYTSDSRKAPDMEALLSKVFEAEVRAKELLQRRTEDGGGAPLTTAFKLTQAIRGYAQGQ